MSDGRTKQLIKQTGEYLVAAELCRRGMISTSFSGNVPVFDLLAINSESKTYPVQVKTSSSGCWQLDAKKFIEITIKKGFQDAGAILPGYSDDLIFVFVALGKPEEGKDDQFFILRMSRLQEIIRGNYGAMLKRHNGQRPQNKKSTHTAIRVRDIVEYRNNWRLFE